ncbi:MAG: hypothetical protein WA138_04030 [Parvibaculum sp.]
MTRYGIVSLLGIVVFAVTLWLGVIGPKSIAHPIPGDGRDPIIAFEMVRSPADLTTVIGEDRFRFADLRAQMDKVNQIDFIYLSLYGAFIAGFFMAVSHQRGDRRWLILSLVAVVAMLADVRENMVLLTMTKGGGDVATQISALMLVTWIKWFGLGLTSLGAALAFFEDHSMPNFRLAGALVGVSAAAFTVAAYFNPFKYAEYMALAIFVTWILMVFYAYRVDRAVVSSAS